MATLGQMLSAAADPQSLERWVEDSPGLARAINDARGASGIAPAILVRRTVAEFSEAASEEDWAQLMTRIRQAVSARTTAARAYRRTFQSGRPRWPRNRNRTALRAPPRRG